MSNATVIILLLFTPYQKGKVVVLAKRLKTIKLWLHYACYPDGSTDLNQFRKPFWPKLSNQFFSYSLGALFGWLVHLWHQEVDTEAVFDIKDDMLIEAASHLSSCLSHQITPSFMMTDAYLMSWLWFLVSYRNRIGRQLVTRVLLNAVVFVPGCLS